MVLRGGGVHVMDVMRRNEIKAPRLSEIHVKSGSTPITDNPHTLFIGNIICRKEPYKVCGLSVIGVGPDLTWISDKR